MLMSARSLGHTRCYVFAWVAMACHVLWAGVLELQETLDAVFCAVRDWGMNLVFECIALVFVRSGFQHHFQYGCTMSPLLNQSAQGDVVYFVTVHFVLVYDFDFASGPFVTCGSALDWSSRPDVGINISLA
jgi:hypothetical protein